MKVLIQKDYDNMSEWAARHIIDAINSHREDRPFVLGLPTGSSTRTSRCRNSER